MANNFDEKVSNAVVTFKREIETEGVSSAIDTLIISNSEPMVNAIIAKAMIELPGVQKAVALEAFVSRASGKKRGDTECSLTGS